MKKGKSVMMQCMVGIPCTSENEDNNISEVCLRIFAKKMSQEKNSVEYLRSVRWTWHITVEY